MPPPRQELSAAVQCSASENPWARGLSAATERTCVFLSLLPLDEGLKYLSIETLRYGKMGTASRLVSKSRELTDYRDM